MRRLLSGFLAGMCATAPMTMVMVLVHRMLPGHEQAPLPPYQITMRATDHAGEGRRQNEAQPQGDEQEAQERVGLAIVYHFGFGAGAGALYGLLAKAIPASGVAGGVIYGLIVWSTSYLGVLPATGLYQEPEREPVRRHAMMIAAHLVWGSVLGLLFQKLTQGENASRLAPRQHPTLPARPHT